MKKTKPSNFRELCNYFGPPMIPFTRRLLFIPIVTVLLISSFSAKAQFQVGQSVEGSAVNEFFGTSVSISDNGNIMAVGSSGTSNVRVFENQSGTWVQIGQDLMNTSFDEFGRPEVTGHVVSLSGDGTILAVGSPLHVDPTSSNNVTNGEVRVFEFQTDTWVQIGQTLNGARGDRLGNAIDMSTNGTRMVVGNFLADDNGSNSGEAIIYDFSGGTWSVVGQHINGETDFDFLGSVVTISGDGTTVAVSAAQNDNAVGTDAGFTKVYENQSNTWVQIGQTILGEAAEDFSGASIDLSNDGTVLAVGSTGNDGNGTDAGHVRVFELQSTTWVQVGQDIDGEAAGDFAGFVSIDGNGDRVAIAASGNDDAATDAGHVRIYDNQAGTWVLVSEDIDGEGEFDRAATIALSKDGNVLAYGAPSHNAVTDDEGHVRVFNGLDNQAPDVVAPLPDLILDQGFRTELVNFGSVFLDPNGDGFTVGFTSSNTDVAIVSGLSSNIVITEGTVLGSTTITLTANDGNGGIATDEFVVTVQEPDVIAPTAVVSTTESSPTNAASIPITVTFSEEVSGFTSGDLSVSNGTLSGFTTTDNVVFTFDVAPVADGDLTVQVGRNVAGDLAGNANTESNRLLLVIDQTRPTVIVSSATTSPTSATSIPFTVTFSEPVVGFQASDISLSNGDVSDLMTADNTVFTFNATSLATGAVSVGVDPSVTTDAAGNANFSSSFLIFNIDREGSTAVVSTTESNPTNASLIPVTITFNERTTGLVAGNVIVANGNITGFTTADNTVFTLNVTPENEGNVTISVPQDVTTDLAGNNNVASNELVIGVDQTSPTPSVSTPGGSLTNAAAISIRVTFDEEVSDFVSADVSVTNGVVGGFISGNNVVFEMTVIPAGDGDVVVSIAEGVATDLAGNSNVASNELTVTIDQTDPTVVISTMGSSPTNTTAIPVTITFSEEVSDFVAGDISVTNGSISGFATTDNTVFTFDVTPSADGDVVVNVVENVAADPAGNGNTASNQLTVTSDQTAPSIGTRATTQNNPTANQIIDFRYVWREEVVGFTVDDVQVANGTISDFTTTDNITFTFNVTAAERGNVSVSVLAGAAMDLAGNSSAGTNAFSIFYEPYNRWLGTINSSWNESGNWFNGEIPTASDNVNIPNRSIDPVIADGEDISFANLELDANAVLTVSTGGSLLVNDVVMGTRAEVIVDASASLTAANIALNGTLTKVVLRSGGALVVSGTSTGTGFVSVERSVVGNSGLSIIGSPIETTPFVAINPDFAFTYDEASNSFETKTSPFTAGEGVFVGFDQVSPTVIFSGTLNTGTVNIPLGHQGSGENGVADGFNMVANPYAAAISRSDFIAANSSLIDGNVWLWSDGGQNTGTGRGGDYIVVNDMGAIAVTDGDGVTGNSGVYDVTNDLINSVQGFFVLAEPTANGSNLTFNASMQTVAGNADVNFFRETTIADNRDLVKLSLSGTTDNADLYNEIIVGLDERATLGEDFALDALKFSGNSDISFYSMQNGQRYSIQALPGSEDVSTEVSLGFELSTAGDYLLKVEEIQLNTPGTTIFLHDEFTGLDHDLSQVGEISFNHQGTASDGRFSLRFNPSLVTSIPDLPGRNLKILSGDQSGIEIIYTGSKAPVKLYDLSGKILFDQSMEFGNEEVQRLNIALSPSQLYILKVEEEVIKFRID